MADLAAKQRRRAGALFQEEPGFGVIWQRQTL